MAVQNIHQIWIKFKRMLGKPKQKPDSIVKWLVATKKINFNTYDIHMYPPEQLHLD